MHYLEEIRTSYGMVWYGIIIILERPLAQWATTKAPS